jgi:hypothetical protein
MGPSAASPFVAHQIAPEDSVKAGNQFFDETVPKLVLLRKRWDNETGLDNHFPLEIELTANCVTSPKSHFRPTNACNDLNIHQHSSLQNMVAK